MFQDFPQFVPQSVCLNCPECCRFDYCDSEWRPRVSLNQLGSLQFAEQSPFYQSVDKHGRIVAKQNEDYCSCKFLDLATNKCHIYLERPLECRLYPFLIEKRYKSIFVSVHLPCPYIQQHRHTKQFEDFRETLKKYFSQHAVLEFLRNNDFLVENYSAYKDEIEELFAL